MLTCWPGEAIPSIFNKQHLPISHFSFANRGTHQPLPIASIIIVKCILYFFLCKTT